jgi:hypothetical protein
LPGRVLTEFFSAESILGPRFTANGQPGSPFQICPNSFGFTTGHRVASRNREPSSGEETMTVDERLAVLERAVKRSKWLNVTFGTLLAISLAGLGYILFGTPAKLRARKIEIVSDKGAAIELSSSSDGDGFLSLSDAQGIPKVRMGVSRKNVGMIETYAHADQKVVSIGGSGAGGQVGVFNAAGAKVVDIQSSKTNCGTIIVNDYDGVFHGGLSGDRR